MMGNTILPIFILSITIVTSLSLEHVSKRSIDSVKSKLLAMFGKSEDSITASIAALDDSLDILKCLPTQCSGGCCRSRGACMLPKLDKRPYYTDSRAYIMLCKDPWKIRIDLNARLKGVFRLGSLKFRPIEIIFDHQKINGITVANENVRAVSASIGPLRIFKVNFLFNLFIRWDCTRPSDSVKRLKYNQMYGGTGNNMNKLFYTIRVRYEIKKKNWLFKYKCINCGDGDVVNKKKAFGNGPTSCKSDWSEWSRCTFFMGCEGMPARRQCVGQSTGGPACPGRSTRTCPRMRPIGRNRYRQCP